MYRIQRFLNNISRLILKFHLSRQSSPYHLQKSSVLLQLGLSSIECKIIFAKVCQCPQQLATSERQATTDLCYYGGASSDGRETNFQQQRQWSVSPPVCGVVVSGSQPVRALRHESHPKMTLLGAHRLVRETFRRRRSVRHHPAPARLVDETFLISFFRLPSLVSFVLLQKLVEESRKQGDLKN